MISDDNIELGEILEEAFPEVISRIVHNYAYIMNQLKYLTKRKEFLSYVKIRKLAKL